jgi:hypothetical protein
MASSNIKTIKGDILDAKEDYIVQQCCCTAVRPAGLSKAIAERFDVNPYATRRPMKKGGNTSVEEDRATPGSCVILGERKVACLFAQYAQGKPGANEIADGAKDRRAYFSAAFMDLIVQIAPDASLAIPYKIGCGLAGGNWDHYERLLNKIAAANPRLTITIYQLP